MNSNSMRSAALKGWKMPSDGLKGIWKEASLCSFEIKPTQEMYGENTNRLISLADEIRTSNLSTEGRSIVTMGQ
jgi:hypothetical protein